MGYVNIRKYVLMQLSNEIINTIWISAVTLYTTGQWVAVYTFNLEEEEKAEEEEEEEEEDTLRNQSQWCFGATPVG